MELNTTSVIDSLCKDIRRVIADTLKKRGAVVGISGGIDSSVVAALCAKALGKDRVVGLALPEKDSSSESQSLAENLANKLGIEFQVENITKGLEGMGAYTRRDEAIQRVFGNYRSGMEFKITLQSDPMKKNILNTFQGTVTFPDGKEESLRLPLKEYMQIVAASNMKQRLRMTMLYYHAEARNYAVAGTGNKNEHELGFFVKYGDGGADLKPIIHLYKTQVYQLAKALGIPREIIERIPTTDTYPGEVTQEEFFFRLPFNTMDEIWEYHENQVSVHDIAAKMNISPEQAQRIVNDIDTKRKNTEYLRMEPLAVQ